MMNGNDWYADDAPLNWVAIARQLSAWNTGERPAGLRGYACVSPRAALRVAAEATAMARVRSETRHRGETSQ